MLMTLDTPDECFIPTTADPVSTHELSLCLHKNDL